MNLMTTQHADDLMAMQLFPLLTMPPTRQEHGHLAMMQPKQKYNFAVSSAIKPLLAETNVTVLPPNVKKKRGRQKN
jgi:hypothetical protein